MPRVPPPSIDSTPSAQSSAPIIHRLTVATLLLAGIIWWCYFFGRANFATFGPLGPGALIVFILIIAAAISIPPIRAALIAALDSVRSPKPAARCAIALGAGVVSSAYLLLTAYQQNRSLAPYLHDEFSYLIQAHQLARGRLWMPPHPLAPFFDSFQLIIQHVYASAYFPGTAMLYVPGIWLHLPPWITSLAITGAVTSLCYRIITELIDGVAGLLAVLLLLSSQMFRELSLMTMGQSPLLLCGLLATLAWLKWRGGANQLWSLLLGAALALAAITRPVDALCFIVPLGIAFLSDLRRRPKPTRSIALAAIGAAPFLILQLILNVGITGHLLQTPFSYYADRDYPNTSYGFHPYDPNAHPVSDLPQKQDLYRLEVLPLIAQHQPGNLMTQTLRLRLPLTLSQSSSTPFPPLVILLPIALAGLSRPRAVILAVLPLFVCLYSAYTFFLFHYVVVVAPALIGGILIGAEQLASSFGRWQKWVSLGLSILIAGIAIAALPQFDPSVRDEMFDAPLIRAVDEKLAPLGNAVVLFHYSALRNLHEEPVYNSSVAWPDDASVIRANDRGSDNSQLFQYYAIHTPGRAAYRFDEDSRSLVYLGTVDELAKR